VNNNDFVRRAAAIMFLVVAVIMAVKGLDDPHQIHDYLCACLIFCGMSLLAQVWSLRAAVREHNLLQAQHKAGIACLKALLQSQQEVPVERHQKEPGQPTV
jgi:uncharacterized membrane protein YqjE